MPQVGFLPAAFIFYTENEMYKTEAVAIRETVQMILDDVQAQGDRAVIEYVRRFDRVDISTGIRVPPKMIRQCTAALDKKLLRALDVSIDNVREFSLAARPQSWTIETKGKTLGEICRPVGRAGIYIPGGRAFYPSSVIMTVLPAMAAGVKNIAVSCPPSDKGYPSRSVLGLCGHLGITEVYRVGGPMAIAAFAFGTKSIPRVDVIAGPGNRYVDQAKRLVYGQVGIDLPAGVSEIGIIADGSAQQELIIAEAMAQKEHDPLARIWIYGKIDAQSISSSLVRKGINDAVIKKCSLKLAIRYMNLNSPEHLALYTSDPESLLPEIQNAGAIFLGSAASVAHGDYIAGPSHVLPTNQAARFSSPLSVNTFIKRSSIIKYSPAASRREARQAVAIAEAEGLLKHKEALRLRA
jgi:histidinol dehydrogenase